MYNYNVRITNETLISPFKGTARRRMYSFSILYKLQKASIPYLNILSDEIMAYYQKLI